MHDSKPKPLAHDFQVCGCTPNLPTNVVDFRGFDSSIILSLKGWNSQSHREFPKKFDSSNVSTVGIMLVGRLGVYGVVDAGKCAAVSIL